MEQRSAVPRVDDDAPRTDDHLTAWYGVPPLGEHHVSRPRLISFLNSADPMPLVLVSAPAGTGKTSLAADWVTVMPESDRTVWVTYEAEDASFWPNLVGGLERFGVPVSPRAFPDSAVAVDRRSLASLTGALARLPERVTIVVDGYELVSPEVAADVDFLLRHNGHRLRLVILARADPVLPLYRYRLADSIAEVRMADLAFRDDEAALLLAACGVTLGERSVHALNSRLEGWAVGLRFAARMLGVRGDPERAVGEVVGDSGNISEYLLGEVLDAQSSEVRELLLSTCIPDTIQPGLAEELGGRSAARTLNLLTRRNAFIEPVPQHPGSFRYHPFFRDLLRAQLAYESPDLVERLHLKAAEWYTRQGLLDKAVSHYAAVDAWADAAAEIVDSLAFGQLLLPGSNSLARTLDAIPKQLHDAAASVVRAALALAAGDGSTFVEQSDLALEYVKAEDSHHVRAVSLAIAVLQAVRGRYLEDATATLALVEHAEEALAANENRDELANRPELVALVLASKGSARARQGQLTEAFEAFAAGAGAAGRLGAESLLFECLSQMAVVACFRGQVSAAHSLAARAVALADSAGIPEGQRSTAAASAFAWINAERGDIRNSIESVDVAEGRGKTTDDPLARTLLTVAKARLRTARGDPGGALSDVDETSAALADSEGWLMHRLRIEKGRLHVAKGEPDAALLDVKDTEPDRDAEVAVVVAQARLQQGDADSIAGSLPAALAKDAPLPTQVEGWLVEAARQMQGGSATRARSALHKSLRLATPESVRRPFREAEFTVRQLLARDSQLQRDHPWLSGGSLRVDHGNRRQPLLPGPAEFPDQRWAPVVEALTAKELEVLGHLAELLTTEEIASTMFVSVNTIRTHVRSILRKLGVSRRNAAVRRARELQLLPVRSVAGPDPDGASRSV
jgi:LuxR family maltose regulon positive regulatory protein